jgi:tRNA(Ile)-lysidine synthase
MKIDQTVFNKFINSNFLFEKKPEIAVAVSGGPDSMALLFLLSNWVKKNKGNLIALIVNHNLRSDSFVEAKFVRKYLLDRKIKAKILEINKAKIKKKNMQEARINRFNILNSYCLRNNILHLFFGHHKDDNLETFFIRKIAGSNIEGLMSIQKKTIYNKVRVLRPMLKYKKKDILKYTKNNNIEFVQDPSTDNLQYTRIKVRSFLFQDKFITSFVQKDFDKINNLHPLYKKMIFQILNKLTIQITSKLIVINSIKLFLHDKTIQHKIVEIILNFLNNHNKPIRAIKIINCTNQLSSKNSFKINFANVYIEKNKKFINFSN